MSELRFDPASIRAEWSAMRDRAQRLLGVLAEAAEVQVGVSAKDVVYEEEKLRLYRYRPLPGVPRTGPALLICYALVNRPYMLDLQPDRSMIHGLLQQGLDVFLIDWGYPDGADRYQGMSDYIDGYLHRCVRKVSELGDAEQINLLGVCQGGTLSLCYTALHPERVKNLITMVTPVDFQTPADLLSKWVQALDVQALVGTYGNIPGDFLNNAFLALMPFRLMGQKYVQLLDMVDDRAKIENFLRMEKWIFDSPAQPGEMFRQFVTHLYKENGLVRGTLKVSGRPVDLRRVTQPVLNVYATQDHLVPPAASLCLEDLLGSRDYTAHAFSGGHIGIYVSARSQKEIPPLVAGWLKKRDR